MNGVTHNKTPEGGLEQLYATGCRVGYIQLRVVFESALPTQTIRAGGAPRVEYHRYTSFRGIDDDIMESINRICDGEGLLERYKLWSAYGVLLVYRQGAKPECVHSASRPSCPGLDWGSGITAWDVADIVRSLVDYARAHGIYSEHDWARYNLERAGF